MMRVKLGALCIAALMFAAACGGAQNVKPRLVDVAPTSAPGQALQAWFEGDEAAAARILDQASTTPEHAFVAGEIAFAAGDVESAFERYAWVVKNHPDHAFTRYAAARLYTMRDWVIDYPSRGAALLDGTDTRKLDPLARLYVAMMEQAVTFRLWDRSDVAQPFEGSTIGLPDRWNLSPVASPFRLTDFDKQWAPETDRQLADTYLSPAFATQTAQNAEKTRPYFPTGLNLAPQVTRDGVYYLETFATATAAQDLWIYGNFAGRAQLIIDGQVVLDRHEDDYQTGKRLRKVRLSAGTHRVLVKLGVQRGYRDWFDLQFVPQDVVTRTGLTFQSGCLADRLVEPCHEGGASKDARVEMLTDAVLPSALEPVFVPSEHTAQANDLSLYLTMLGAYFSAEDAAFDAAWTELAQRRPDFAAGHALRSLQVQTLWQWPSRLRDATALQELRTAHELDPSSVLVTHQLAQKVGTTASDREVRELTERAARQARDGDRVLLLPALAAWAEYLEAQGYDDASERAWQGVRDVAPNHCDAARAIQKFEQSRNVFSRPDALVKDPGACPALVEAYDAARADREAESLAHYAKYAARFPENPDTQVRYANELVRAGRLDEARAVVAEGLKRAPDAPSLWSWRVDRLFAEKGAEAAIAELRRAEDAVGSQAWIVWKRAMLDQKIPLMKVMPDGHKAAMDAVEAAKTRALSSDDAYYVMDFAATQYFPDGANITLTHTVVRVLTKNAIDRYAETQVPSDARVLRVRTIKQDGTTQIPEETAGKQTLSMPGLAEGDFVEVAFIQFNDRPFPRTSRDGVKFFFRMEDISTLHSEYMVLGDLTQFLTRNAPPNAEPVQFGDLKGVRFLAKDNPRPREERFAVGVDEYLPWIQMYENGVTLEPLEVLRRARLEQLRDGSKPSDEFRAQVDRWLQELGEMNDTDKARALFYRVTAWIPEPSLGDFETDVSHAMLTREGNTLTLLHAAYAQAGIVSDVVFVRSPYASTDKIPNRESGLYSTPLLRVRADGKTYWASPSGPDAMFGAVETMFFGQEALCVTCEDAADQAFRLPLDGFPINTERVAIDADVDAKGDLRGTLRIVVEGASAEPLRAGLRARTDDANREKLMGAIAAQLLAGSSVEGFEIVHEGNPDLPLELVLKVERPGFARANAGGMSVETRLFEEPLARFYASLPERTVPMMVSYPRQGEQTMTLRFPRTPRVLSLSGTRELKSPFGQFKRSVRVEGNAVVLENAGELPIQRVSVDDYAAFQKWAISVEQNSPFVVVY